RLLVSCAAAFALAGVFAFAVVVGGLAATLALAIVHSFAGVLRGHRRGVAGGAGRAHGRTIPVGVIAFTTHIDRGGPGDQTGHRGGGEKSCGSCRHRMLLPESVSFGQPATRRGLSFIPTPRLNSELFL